MAVGPAGGTLLIPKRTGVRVTRLLQFFPPCTRTTWSFHWSSKKKLCQLIIISWAAQAPELLFSAAISSFKIGRRLWKLVELIRSIGRKVFKTRKRVETFGAQYEINHIHNWSYMDALDVSLSHYIACHIHFSSTLLSSTVPIIKNQSKIGAQKQPKNVAPAPLASNAAGPSVAVSNDKDAVESYLSCPEITNAGDLS
jgi:hypothetical protein